MVNLNYAINNASIGRCAFAACTIGSETIIVLGGFDGESRLNLIESYSSVTNQWNILPHRLPIALSNLATFSIGNEAIVILGGGSLNGFYLDVQMLNFTTGEWTEFQGLSQGRDLRNKVVIHENRVYAIGGNTFSGEHFHLKTNTWAPIQQYPITHNLDSWCCALSYQLPKGKEITLAFGLEGNQRVFSEDSVQQNIPFRDVLEEEKDLYSEQLYEAFD